MHPADHRILVAGSTRPEIRSTGMGMAILALEHISMWRGKSLNPFSADSTEHTFLVYVTHPAIFMGGGTVVMALKTGILHMGGAPQLVIPAMCDPVVAGDTVKTHLCVALVIDVDAELLIQILDHMASGFRAVYRLGSLEHLQVVSCNLPGDVVVNRPYAGKFCLDVSPYTFFGMACHAIVDISKDRPVLGRNPGVILLVHLMTSLAKGVAFRIFEHSVCRAD